MTQTLAPAPKQTAAEKRMDFLADVAKPINDHFKAAQLAKQLGQPFPEQPAPEVFTEAARRYAEEGPALGRTDRWKNACAFPQAEIDAHPGDAAHARWAVLQGSVYLGYAAD